MSTSILSPFPSFNDLDGTPLENGYIYIGTQSLNPATSPIPIFWDEALTQPAAQPLRTVGGFFARSGTPSRVYASTPNYSILVTGSNQEIVYSELNVTGGPIFNGYPIASDLVTFLQPDTGAVIRTAQDKLTDSISVKDFGAFGNGSTSDNFAFLAMASTLGFIVVSRGDFLLTTTNIDVPIFFNEGGAVKANSSNTITFRNRIFSSKQQIFKGDGDYRFKTNGNLGEDSKHSYAAWFGIFPVGQATTIQTAAFNKALAAYTAEVREGTFELDIGSYRLDGTITIPRGVHFKGAGTRLTIFDLVGDGYTAIQTENDPTSSACRITGIQFERPVGSESYFNGTQIKLNNGTHMLDDIRVQSAKVGIEVTETASFARITRVAGIYNEQPLGGYPVDSAVIWVKGDKCQIDNVSVVGVAYGPASIILLGYNSTSGVANSTITNIQHTEKSRGVKFWANQNDITSAYVNGVVFFGDDTTAVNSLIDITTEGTGNSVSNVVINGIVSNSLANNLLTINQGSTGVCENITFVSGSANSSLVKAATLTRTAGTVRNIVIGDGVNANLNATPVVLTGTDTFFQNIYISPRLTPKVNQPSYNWYFGSFANDTATSVTIGNFIFTGVLLVSVGTTRFGMYVIRAASTPVITQMITPGANMNTTTGVLTGTTGSSGAFTVSVTSDGRIYVENRLGTAQNINLTLMSASS